MSCFPLALVTGANRGIGYAIAKQLLQKNINVILGCRNSTDGEIASEKLRNEIGISSSSSIIIDCMELDIANKDSIAGAKDYLSSQYKNGINILINNAGIASERNVFNSPLTQRIFNTNFYGTINLTQSLLPLLTNANHSQFRNYILFMCSRTGNAKNIPDIERRERLIADDLTVDELYEMVDKFLSDLVLMEKEMGDEEINESFDICKEKLVDYGWWGSSYGMSKLMLAQYLRILCQSSSLLECNPFVGGYCPGLVSTDMTAGYANRRSLTADEGAMGIIELCTSDVGKYSSGKYWAPVFSKIDDEKQFVELSNVDWKDCKLPRKPK